MIVSWAYTVDYLNQLLKFEAAKIYEEEYSFLIVDCIMALWRVDYSGRGVLFK